MNYANLIVRWRYLVVLLCTALVIAFGTGLSKLKLSTNLEVFFAEDDPQLIAYDAVRDTYTRDDNLFLVFEPADGKVFTPENLAIVEELTEKAWLTPHAIRVDSVTNFQHTAALGDDLQVSPLVEDALNMSLEAIARARDIAVNEPLISGKLITASAHLTALNITIELPNIDRSKEIPEAVAYARELRKELQAAHPGADLKITGKVAGNLSFTEAALYDMSNIVPLALVIALLCIAGFLTITSGSLLTGLLATFATILVIVGSVVIGLGGAGWLGIDISPPVSNAPTVILTLAVADCMHLLVSYFQARRMGKIESDAVAYTLELNRQPVFLTSLTTVIGFIALNFSEAPPFHDLGNTVAVGIVAAWLLSMVFLPALLAILPLPVKRTDGGQSHRMEALANIVLSRPRLFFVISLILIAAAATGIPKNRLY
ncbi:MAG: efflux RND transporter permease subunit, partial [Oceanococcus sp.]